VNDRLLVDECLSVSLVAVAKDRGIAADHVTYLGKGGWQDRNLVPFAVEYDYVMVTNNRRHFLKEYAKLDIHSGLIVIIPAVKREIQQRLFERALDALTSGNEAIVNKVVEVLLDGTVHIREWTSEDHDIGHISNPAWGR
jgi:predicted nuclease of predicted toxin-antitoxin system